MIPSASARRVLILVVMEEGQRLSAINAAAEALKVLILVVMEEGQRRGRPQGYPRWYEAS